MREKPASISATGTSARDFSASVCSISLVWARASASRGDSSRTRFSARFSIQAITSAVSYTFDWPRVFTRSIGMPSFCHCQIVTSVLPTISASSVWLTLRPMRTPTDARDRLTPIGPRS